MKKHHLALCVAVTALAVTTSASAEEASASPLYGEIGYVSLSLKESVGPVTVKVSPSVLTGTIGYRVLPNLSIEGMGAFGLGSDEIKVDGVGSGISAKIGTSFGVFLRPSVKLSERVELFARAGFLRTQLKLAGQGISESDSSNDLAYGFGVNVDLSKSSYVQGSWGNYYDKDGLKINGLGVAYGLRF